MTESATEDTSTTEESSSTTEDSTDWKAEARKWEQRAKEHGKAKVELEKAQRASMTEADRAIAEAETRGRTTAATQYGERLARTQFDAYAGRRNADFDTSQALEFVDLKKFLGDDGEPDTKAIQAAVNRLVPESTSKPPSFDGGARSTAGGKGDMNSLIRKAAGLG